MSLLFQLWSESQIEMRSINFLPLKLMTLNIVTIHVSNSHDRYTDYLCNVPCRVMWIILYHCFDLVSSTACLTKSYRVFRSNILLLNVAIHLQHSHLWHNRHKRHIWYFRCLHIAIPFHGIKEHQMRKIDRSFLHFNFSVEINI